MERRRTTRVIVADDHATVLSAVVSMLEQEPGFEVVAAVDNGYDAVARARDEQPDLVLLDVQMPGGGAEAAIELFALRPRPVVVAISGATAGATLEELLRAGVTGFVTKGHAGTDLVEVLERCVRGEVVLASPTAAAVLVDLVVAARDAVGPAGP